MKLLPFSKGLFKNFKSSLIEEVLPKDHIRVLMALEKIAICISQLAT